MASNSADPDDSGDQSSSPISPLDRDLMIRTVMGEAGNDASAPGVASVIMNRLNSGKYGDSIPGILFAKNQFEAWDRNGANLLGVSPNSPAYQHAAQVVDGVISGKTPDPTNGATQYYSPSVQAALGRQPPSWDNGTGVMLGTQKFFGGAAPAPSDFLHDFPIASAGAQPASPAAGASLLGAAPPPGAAPASAPGSNDFLHDFPIAGAPPSAGADFLHDFPIAAEGAPPAPSQEASAPPIGVNDAVRAVGTGMPIVGGLLNKMDALTDAGLAPLLNRFYSPQDQLQGDTFGERYTNALATQNGMDANFSAQHPIASNALNIAGGVLGTLPLMTRVPAAFGISSAGLGTNALLSGITGAAIGGADSAVRHGLDISAIKRGAGTGLVFGGLAPIAGEALGAGFNALSNAVSRTTPAARGIANALAGADMTPADAASALARMGPQATLADIDPALADMAGGLAAKGAAPTSILKNAMAARAAGSDDRMAQIVNDALGPAPDADQILNGIRYREGFGAANPATARSALDSAMGPATDPYAQLQNMMQARTAAAKPIYQEALSNPVIWDKRLQQFLDDPIAQSGLSKGVEIQRLESLANDEPFNPNDYVYMGKGVKNDPTTGKFVPSPLIGQAPNFKTLDVIKKGLDGIVQDNRDPVTGKLSQYGVQVDKVRSAFVNKLDDINPDYAAARQAWAGPTVTHEAFNRGLNIFRNQSGSSGVNTTPGALSSWLAKASDGEKDAVKIGARTAFQQQMQSASDPAAKAAFLASKDVNQQKLASVLGPNEAKKLAGQLNFEYTDPVGQAFSKGLDIFQNRGGVPGVGDTPNALQSWLKTASPAEQQAHQQGARQAIEQSLTSARQGDVSAARSLFAKSTANRQKLEMAFPNAGKMLDGLDNELKMRATEQTVAKNSATASREANMAQFTPKTGNGLGGPTAAILGEAVGGGPAAVGATILKSGWGHASNALQEAYLNRLKLGMAKGLSATGPARDAFLGQVARAAKTGAATDALAKGASAGANLLTRTGGNALANHLYLTVHPSAEQNQ